MTVETFDVGGEFTWTCPEGVTSITVEAIGGGEIGGHASAMGGRGGRGGGYSRIENYAVTPSQQYAGFVGNGNGNGNTNFDSWFVDANTLLALGGPNSAASTPGVGDVCYLGGGSSMGGFGMFGAGAGGGSSGSFSSNGSQASGSTGGVAGSGGGNGGNGASSPGNGSDGIAPGGGGGGGCGMNGSGGVGATGKVWITY